MKSKKKQKIIIISIIVLSIISIIILGNLKTFQIINGSTCSEISCAGPCKTLSTIPKQALCCGSNQIITWDNKCATSCTPSCSCASSTCIGSTCSNGCGGTCAGTKNCNPNPCQPSCSGRECGGDGCGGSCGSCGSGKTCSGGQCISSCQPDCSCASDTCSDSTCSNGCSGTCQGTKDCSPSPVCGDTVCNGAEDCNSCPLDCGQCGGGGGDTIIVYRVSDKQCVSLTINITDKLPTDFTTLEDCQNSLKTGSFGYIWIIGIVIFVGLLIIIYRRVK